MAERSALGWQVYQRLTTKRSTTRPNRLSVPKKQNGSAQYGEQRSRRLAAQELLPDQSRERM